MTTPKRGGERIVAALSIGAVIASAAWLRPDEAIAGGVVLLTIVWGTVTFAIDVLLGAGPRAGARRVAEPASVTTIVCVGEEPVDVARATIILAAQAGPAAVVTARPEFLADLGSVDVSIFVGRTVDVALHEAIASVATDAVFVTSASAFPTNGATEVAGALAGPVGWAFGRVEPFTTDAFAPGSRDRQSARLRSRARAAGLTVWEPDATIVRTELLRSLSLEPGRPRGTWLRALAARGYTGVDAPTVVARRAAPTDGPLFWPSEVMRKRGVAADLADAMRSGPIRSRLLAFDALTRELSAYRLLMWLCVPILIAWGDAFPFGVAPVLFVALHATLAAARWAVVRSSVGLRLHPVEEGVATVYEAPASLLALRSVTGRIRPLRFRFPEQPLLLATIALTVAMAVPLFDRPATADPGIDATVGLAILTLAALWVSAFHAVGQRAWNRTTYRLAIDGAAEVSGHPGRLLDASPSGAAIVGTFADIRVGTQVDVAVTFPRDGTTVTMPATVAARRGAGHDGTILGLALTLDAENRSRWIRALFGAAQLTDAGTRLPTARNRLRRRVPEVDVVPHSGARRSLRRVEQAAVGVISLAIIGAVALALVGYRPLVVRSASMVPYLAVGDVAIVDWTRAADVGVGDVITFEVPEVDYQSVTHRVRSVTDADGVRMFETRGDANESSEFWSTPDDELLGRVVARVPAAGRVVARLGQLRSLIVVLGIALVVAAAVVAAWGIRRTGADGRLRTIAP